MRSSRILHPDPMPPPPAVRWPSLDRIGSVILAVPPAALGYALGGPIWAGVGLVPGLLLVAAVARLSRARVIVTDEAGQAHRIPAARSSLEDIR
jgi:hypothetical protein